MKEKILRLWNAFTKEKSIKNKSYYAGRESNSSTPSDLEYACQYTKVSIAADIVLLCPDSDHSTFGLELNMRE